MVNKRNTFGSTCLLLATVLVVSGCQVRGPDMVASGEVSLEKVDAPGVRVMWAEVRQDGDYAVVNGAVTPAGGNYEYIGYVDVKFLDPAGRLVQQAMSETIPLSSQSPERGASIKHFEVQAMTVVPVGGTVQVSYLLGRSPKDLGM